MNPRRMAVEMWPTLVFGGGLVVLVGCIGSAEKAAAVRVVDRLAPSLAANAKAVLAEHGLTYYGFKILAVLRRSGPDYQVTPGELSRSLYVMSGTLTHQLDQLEEAGLVSRLPDPNDRRGVLVQLTDQGKRQIEAALVANSARQQQALAPLSPEERAAAADILRKLLIHLEQGD